MFRLFLSKQITHLVMFVVFVCLSCWIPASVFAQLAIDSHIPTKLLDDGGSAVSAYVSIDSLTYDPSGAGVVYLDGTFYLHNYHTRHGCNYSGELRLDISDAEGNTFEPDAKAPISGSLKKWEEDAPLSAIQVSIPKSVNLYLDCISADTGEERVQPEARQRYTMSAAITLRVTIQGTKEVWAINDPTYTSDFTYSPPEEAAGLGPTTDGETFSDKILGDNCTCIGDRAWKSLLITEIPYDVVYWYIKAPGDTSYYGTNVQTDWGDDAAKRATMTYTFPDDVDDPTTTDVNERGVYYDIGALVYRSDDEIDWHTYKVWVVDKK